MRKQKVKLKELEYKEYLNWLLTPRSSRTFDEKDLTAFALKNKVSRDTLHRWTNSDYFVSDLEKASKGNSVVRLQEVRNAIYENAVLKRDVNAQKLYLNYEAKWNPAQIVEASLNITQNKAILDACKELDAEMDAKNARDKK